MYETINDYGLVVEPFGVEGWRVTIGKWYEVDYDSDYDILYDRNVIADSLYEAVTGALCEIGVDFEVADVMAAEWDIFPPEDEED